MMSSSSGMGDERANLTHRVRRRNDSRSSAGFRLLDEALGDPPHALDLALGGEVHGAQLIVGTAEVVVDDEVVVEAIVAELVVRLLQAALDRLGALGGAGAGAAGQLLPRGRGGEDPHGL